MFNLLYIIYIIFRSLGYVLLFLVKGELPWQNQKEKNKFEKIKDIKIETDLEVLCDGFPQQF